MSWNGKYYIWCVLPFGVSCAPYYFNKILRPVIAFHRQNNIRTVIFVDVFFQIAHEYCSTGHKDFLLDTLEQLGWIVNHEKSQLVPSKNVTFIEFDVNSTGPKAHSSKCFYKKLGNLSVQ